MQYFLVGFTRYPVVSDKKYQRVHEQLIKFIGKVLKEMIRRIVTHRVCSYIILNHII